MTSGDNYRQRIYEKYASQFQDSESHFDRAAADRWGRAYDSYFYRWMPRRKDVPILELACGGGRLLHFFKERGYTNLTGVDISPEQVHLATQVMDNVIEKNVLDFLEQKDEIYDLIVGLDIIEHLYKDEIIRLLDSCYRALRTGGRLVLQTCNADSPMAGSDRYGDFTHETGLTPNSLSRLLSLADFQQVDAREAGPVVHGVASAIRYMVWRVIRLAIKFWNLAETGDSGSGVFTRIFLVTAIKQAAEKEP